MQSGWNVEIRLLAACLGNKLAFQTEPFPDDTRTKSRTKLRMCPRELDPRRMPSDGGRVTVEERCASESSGGVGERRDPVKQRSQSPRGGRHGGRRRGARAQQLFDELRLPRAALCGRD
jgi:hypothetical protein